MVQVLEPRIYQKHTSISTRGKCSLAAPSAETLTAKTKWDSSLVGRDLARVGKCSSLIDYVVTYVTCCYTCCRASDCRSGLQKPDRTSNWWIRLSISKLFSNVWTLNYWSGSSARNTLYCWLTIRHRTRWVSHAISWRESTQDVRILSRIKITFNRRRDLGPIPKVSCSPWLRI